LVCYRQDIISPRGQGGVLSADRRKLLEAFKSGKYPGGKVNVINTSMVE